MFETIVVPLDGSERASKALAHAIEVADKHGAELHVVSVVDTRLYGEPALSTLELAVDELEDEAHDRIQDAVERAKARELAVVTRCCHGVPHDTIREYADAVDADLVVMGYRGETHEKKMGSVARRVVADARKDDGWWENTFTPKKMVLGKKKVPGRQPLKMPLPLVIIVLIVMALIISATESYWEI